MKTFTTIADLRAALAPHRLDGRTIGLAVMDVANPFFADLLRGAQSELSSNGFGATIGDADNNAELQLKVLRSFLAQRVRGVILGPIVGTSIYAFNTAAPYALIKMMLFITALWRGAGRKPRPDQSTR